MSEQQKIKPEAGFSYLIKITDVQFGLAMGLSCYADYTGDGIYKLFYDGKMISSRQCELIRKLTPDELNRLRRRT